MYKRQAKAKVLVLDKTGTITSGAPMITDVYPAAGVSREVVFYKHLIYFFIFLSISVCHIFLISGSSTLYILELHGCLLYTSRCV